jgi:hypothetical protein
MGFHTSPGNFLIIDGQFSIEEPARDLYPGGRLKMHKIHARLSTV